MNTVATLLVVSGVVLASAACSGTQSSPPAPSSAAATASGAEARDAGGPLTAARCKELGGEVVGDIGNGAIHQPGYRCPRSGEPPLDHIAIEPGQPMPIEGAVCCR